MGFQIVFIRPRFIGQFGNPGIEEHAQPLTLLPLSDSFYLELPPSL